MMKTSYLLLISMFLFLSINVYGFDENIIPDPLNYQEMPFDVLNYDVSLDLRNYKTKKMEGICKITVFRKEIYDGDYFIFHLKSLNITNISSDGKILNYTHQLEDDNKFSHYRVEYPDQTSDTVVFEITYSGTMTNEITNNIAWGGVYYEENVLYAIGAGISAPYISTARHWMPCFDLPQDKATFKGSFTVPSNLLVASNGLLIETNDIDETSKEFVWQTDFQTATYLLTFAAAPYLRLEYSNYDVPIEIYTLVVDSARSDFVYRRLPEVAECYSNLFGDYPFEKIGYCNTTKGAMEHQTMISIPRSIVVSSYSIKDDNHLTIAHELAHQWFGNLVSPKDFRDVWLNESFANYSEALWENCRAGKEAYLQNILYEKDRYLISVAPYEGILPIYDFSREAPSSNYPTTIYAKGSVVLGMLYYELERNNINLTDILRDYLSQYKFSNISTTEFIQFLKDKSNLDLDWFFEQWVYSAGWAKLAIDLSNIQNDKLSSKFTIKQTEGASLFKNLPVEISYYIGDDEYTIVELISDETTEVNLGNDIDFQIDSIRVNTGKEVVGLYEIDVITSVNSGGDEIAKPYQLYQSDNQLTINYQSKYGYSKFVIYDILGNIIVNEENNSKYGMNSFRFNFSELQSSVYFINLVIDNTIFTEKISIIK